MNDYIKGLFILGFCFIMLSSPAFTLDPNKAISQYTLDVWGIEKGLPQSTVYTVIQSRAGYIWMGTEEGLVRFDGVNFKVYDKSNVPQILNNFIKILLEDREGNLWIGTRGGGLACLNAKDGTFSCFTTQQGLASNILEAIYEDHNGVLWIGTGGGGLDRFDGTENEGNFEHGVRINNPARLRTFDLFTECFVTSHCPCSRQHSRISDH